MGDAHRFLASGARQAAAEAAEAAAWVRDFVAPTYGPGGLEKIVDRGKDPVLAASGASALLESGVQHPAARPYVDLARTVQLWGDQSSSSLLLAARMVHAGSQLAPATALDGLRLARRQSLAVLDGMAYGADPELVLQQVSPDAAWVHPLLSGLEQWEGPIDLDCIDLQVERRGAPRWLEGLRVKPSAAPDLPSIADGGVLVVAGDERPRQEVSLRLGAPSMGIDQTAGPVAAVKNLAVRLVACRRSLGEELTDRLASAGVVVVNDCPEALATRLRLATGAGQAPHLRAAGRDDVGRAELHRLRDGSWSVRGPGHAATFQIIAHNASQQEAVRDAGERLLRSAGALLQDPRAVPGGGRWQREVERSLRQAQDAAPGKSPLMFHAVAQAFGDLAADLVRNTGADPHARSVLDEVHDPYPAVRRAVEGAFATAQAILRLDGRYQKRKSDPQALRGGSDRIGSPKGMPGDVPPLM